MSDRGKHHHPRPRGKRTIPTKTGDFKVIPWDDALARLHHPRPRGKRTIPTKTGDFKVIPWDDALAKLQKSSGKPKIAVTQTSPTVIKDDKMKKHRKTWCSDMVVFDRKEMIEKYHEGKSWKIVIGYAKKLVESVCQNKVNREYSLDTMKNSDLVIAAMDKDGLCGFALVKFSFAVTTVSVICSAVKAADVGKKLLDKAEEEGRKRGKRYLVLCALGDAVGFYLKAGFQFVKHGHQVVDKYVYEEYSPAKTEDFLEDNLSPAALKKHLPTYNTSFDTFNSCILMMRIMKKKKK